MSSIDERIVSMKFNYQNFMSGIKTTLDGLANLKKGLNFDGSKKGLEDLSNAGKNFTLGNMGTQVEGVNAKFLAMATIAITALARITSAAITTGASLIKSLTVSPITQGLHEYETNLNAIQTILANTQSKGTVLADVNAALQQLNEYSDKTIYNFSEMARNIGTFTAAGVDLNTSVNAIKGIANLAAVSGSSSAQASTAMYQLSQALSTGTVKLMDWNSVVNAGMGGELFQENLKETARVHGVAVDSIIEEEGSFRDSLQKGWLTSEILTESLSKMTGDLTDQQLEAMGYTAEQIVGIQKMAQTAQDAATKVKTVSQLIGTLQEAAGSGWAKTWEIFFGDFEEAKTLFTNVNNVLGGMITASADARNKVLGDWKALGGRTAIIDAISNAFTALMNIVKPIKDAFRQIFPATTGQQLYELSVAIRDFTAGLIIGAGTAEKLQRTFAGVFAIFGIGWEVIKQIISVLARLFGVATEGSGSFLDVTASVGDFLVKLHDAIKNGEGLTNFFTKLGDILEVPIRLIKQLGGLLLDAFKGLGNLKAPDFGGGFDKFISQFSPLSTLGDIAAAAWGKVIGALQRVWDAFQPIAGGFADVAADIGRAISGALSGLDFDAVLGTLNTGVLAGALLLFKKLVDAISGFGGTQGFLVNISSSFELLTGTLSSMQNTLRAATLLQIAAAIGIMTLSVSALSKIDSEGLTRALTAMTVMFTQLFASLAVFQKIMGSSGFVRMPLLAASLILLGTAINILATAVEKLSGLDWQELAKGLTGVTVLIGGLVVAGKGLQGSAPGMIRAGAGLILLAAAIRILVGAVTDLSGLSWEELAKGLVGVGALLASLALFGKFAGANKAGLIQGAGIILLAAGIKILASAVEDFAAFSWEELGRGLAGMAGGLVLIAGALKLIPPSSVLSAAAVLVVAASLGMVADAIGDMGNMSWEQTARGLVALAGALVLIAGALALLPPSSLFSAAAIFTVASSLGMITDALGDMGSMGWEEIAKGLITLAASLGIIALAMAGMTTALPGAAALLVVAASLKLLQPVLQAFGEMTWEEMAKGLLMLAGAFVVIGAAGLLLTPVVPTLLGLGIAIALLGVGMAAAGAGILAFSVALTALAVVGAAGAAAIVGIVSALVGLIPLVMEQIALGIVAFARVIATAGPAMTEAMVTVLNAILDAIARTSPKIISTLELMLSLMLGALVRSIPKMVNAGLQIIIGVLNGIASNIGGIVNAATNVVVNFINAIAANLPRVIQAGVNLILSFINGTANAIRNNSAAMGAAGANLGSAIIEGMARGLTAGIATIASKARQVAQNALNAAKSALGINSPSKEFFKIGQYSDEGFAKGLGHFSGAVEKEAVGVGKTAITALTKTISGMSDLIGDDIDLTPRITPVLDLTNVRKNAGELGSLLTVKPLSVEGAYSAAKDVSADYANRISENSPEGNSAVTPKVINFTQNNNSPKALSNAELYRQTKNQLSVAKREL